MAKRIPGDASSRPAGGERTGKPASGGRPGARPRSQAAPGAGDRALARQAARAAGSAASRPAHAAERASREHHQPRDGSERVVGLKAAAAVLAARPTHVLNLAHTPDARSQVAELLRIAAKQRIAYREVPPDELERMAGTKHHEGICLLVRERQLASTGEIVEAFATGGFGLVLDGVENPHNVGALLRTAAYFGARAMLVRGAGTQLPPSALRVAEGGAEYVPLALVDDLAASLDALRQAAVAVVVADAHGGQPLHEFVWPARAVVVLGAERQGLSQAVMERRSHRVHIPGSGQIESLNVSVAAGILLAAAARAQSPR